MHVFPASRRLYAALFVGLVAFLGIWLGAGVAAAQAPPPSMPCVQIYPPPPECQVPPPPGPPGTVVNLCTGGPFDQSLDEVAATLRVTRGELRGAVQATLLGASAGTLQQVTTGPSSGLCSVQAGPATPPPGVPPPPPGGTPGSGMGQVTCTYSGSGQPTCTGPGAGQVTCTTATGTDGRTEVRCTSGQPPSSDTCPPTLAEGVAGSGPTTVMEESCTGAASVSGGTTACTSSSSAGVGIVTNSGVRELTVRSYDAVAQHLGHGITGEQVRTAFCTVRR